MKTTPSQKDLVTVDQETDTYSSSSTGNKNALYAALIQPVLVECSPESVISGQIVVSWCH